MDDLYILFVEECGDFEGIFVVFLYGGLGVGVLLMYWWFFDFVCYCIVLLD